MLQTRNLLVFLAVCAIIISAVLYQIEFLNIAMTTKNFKMEKTACRLILEGFLTRRENLWGITNNEVIAAWSDFSCPKHIACPDLSPVYQLHSREILSNTFLGIWDASDCASSSLPANVKVQTKIADENVTEYALHRFSAPTAVNSQQISRPIIIPDVPVLSAPTAVPSDQASSSLSSKGVDAFSALVGMSSSRMPTIGVSNSTSDMEVASDVSNVNVNYLYSKDTIWCMNARDQKPHKTNRKLLDKATWQKLNCEKLCKEADDYEKAKEQKYISDISKFPKSNEKRVISFGLYGSDARYTEGAEKNLVLSKIYFPNWICRFYVHDIPQSVHDKIVSMGGEAVQTPHKSMLSRFFVAIDPTVDRYIVRDIDSRLNARDAFAVQQWIESGMKLHSQRDHLNHCYPFNGGMWGGTKGAIPSFEDRLNSFVKQNSVGEYITDMHFLGLLWNKVKGMMFQQNSAGDYMTDMHFLGSLWNEVKDMTFQHDVYCCTQDRFHGGHPYPFMRPLNYLHVGQVVLGDEPRSGDIESIRGIVAPEQCRLHPEWLYG